MMLSTWGVAVRPLSIGTSGDGMAFGPIISIIAIPFELAQLLVSELIFQLAKSMLLLTCRQSQRAEYLADRLAAQVAGTAASQSALEKTYLEKVVSSALRTRALMSLDGPLEDFLNNAANAVPEPELQALREESRASKWQVDATHPPTAYRVEMLALGGHSFPLILLSPEEQCALDAEMSKLIASNQRSVIDREIEALYQ
jgi:heat shock protein HtpX